MPKSDDYLVYGDDDRVEQEKLKDLSDIADDLLTTPVKKSDKPSDDLDDIENDLLEDSEENIDEQAEEESEGDDEGTAPNKPHLKPTKFFWIVLGACVAFLVVLVLILTGGSNNTEEPAETSEPVATETADAEATVEPTASAEATASASASTDEATNKEGYLKAIDKGHAYTLAETLSFAKTINDTTKDYLTYAVSVVSNYQSDQDVNIKDQLSVKKEMLGYDVETLKTYETMFDTYGGGDYIRTAEERLANVQAMYDAVVGEFSTVNDLVVKANEYITTENTKASEAKTNLIAYLNTNGVTYHVDDNQISYDELQFTEDSEE